MVAVHEVQTEDFFIYRHFTKHTIPICNHDMHLFHSKMLFRLISKLCINALACHGHIGLPTKLVYSKENTMSIDIARSQRLLFYIISLVLVFIVRHQTVSLRRLHLP